MVVVLATAASPIVQFAFWKKQSVPGTPSPTPDVAWLKTQDGSGTSTADAVGNKTGTLSGATIPTWVTGQDGVSGHALSFDGITSWVSLANPPIIGNSSIGSVVIWFKKASGTIATTQVFYGEGRSSDTTPFLLYGFNTSGQIVIQSRDDSSVSATVTTTGTYNDNSWHMAAGVMGSKSSLKLYVDAVLIGTDTTTRGTTTINQCSLGSLNRIANALFYTGTAADVKVYSTALQQSDITLLFSNGTP